MRQEVKDYIIANFEHMTSKQLGEPFGLKPATIEAYKKVLRKEGVIGRKKEMNWYSPEDDALVLDPYLTNEQIAKMTGKSAYSVICHRSYLKRVKGIIPQTIGDVHRDFIKKHYGQMTKEEMANELGLTQNGISSHIRVLQKHKELPRKNPTYEEMEQYCEKIKNAYPKSKNLQELSEMTGIKPSTLVTCISKLKERNDLPKKYTKGQRNLDFIAKNYHEMSYKEMADALGISVKSVPTYLNKLRKKNIIPYKTKEEKRRTRMRTVHYAQNRKYRSRLSKYDIYLDYIKENYYKMTYKQMAEELGIDCTLLTSYISYLHKKEILPKKYKR